MPSILVECGFLTNPKEEEFLHSDLGQDYIASAIFRAFRTYKENIEIEENNLINKKQSISNSTNNDTIVVKEKKKESTLLYKVQIGTFLKSMSNQDQFIELKAEEEKINGTYKYYVLAGSNKYDADKLKDYLREIGFKGAFIVAFLDGKQISTKDALNLQNKISQNE